VLWSLSSPENADAAASPLLLSALLLDGSLALAALTSRAGSLLTHSS